MNADALKGQAILAVSTFNARQTSTLLEIHYASPANMTVIDENMVIFESVRERALISRRIGATFEVVGRQMKLPT